MRFLLTRADGAVLLHITERYPRYCVAGGDRSCAPLEAATLASMPNGDYLLQAQATRAGRARRRRIVWRAALLGLAGSVGAGLFQVAANLWAICAASATLLLLVTALAYRRHPQSAGRLHPRAIAAALEQIASESGQPVEPLLLALLPLAERGRGWAWAGASHGDIILLLVARELPAQLRQLAGIATPRPVLVDWRWLAALLAVLATLCALGYGAYRLLVALLTLIGRALLG